MFGYVTIYHKGLAKPELDRYQAYYCGLCRTLGQKYGLPGQLTLSYDLAFIAILHSALYEPQTQFSAGRCGFPEILHGHHCIFFTCLIILTAIADPVKPALGSLWMSGHIII